jgi:hypothetical protein
MLRLLQTIGGRAVAVLNAKGSLIAGILAGMAHH